MQLLAIRNFRSYQEQLINNLNPRINIILGGNGQGKSNLFKAIRFLLTSATPLKLSYFRANKHDSLERENEAKAVSVEGYIRSQTHGEDLMKVERRWESESKEELRIDDGVYTKRAFESALEAVGYSVSNPYNIIEQGTIGRVAQMTPPQLLTLLQQVSGIKKIDQKITEMRKTFQQSEDNREKAVRALGEVEEALRGYEQSVEEMDQYLKAHKVEQVKVRRRLEGERGRLEAVSWKAKKEEGESGQLLNELRVKLKNVLESQEETEVQLEIALKEMQGVRVSQGAFQTPAPSQYQRKLQAQLHQTTSKASTLKQQLKEQVTLTEQLKKEMEPYRLKYEQMKGHAEKERLRAKGEGKEELRKVIGGLREQMKETESEVGKMQRVREGIRVEDVTGRKEKVRQLKEKGETVGEELRGCQMRLYEANRTINHAESEIEVHSRQAEACLKRMRHALPLLDPRLTQQTIPGVYGYLADFLQIQPSTAFLYEVASLRSLCTLLVQDAEACKRVVEANRRLKGDKLIMLPLTVLKKQATLRKAVPESEEVFSLLKEEWVQVRAHPHGDDFTQLVKKMVSNAFGGHVLVKDYELGLKVSKEYNLTCITPDREVVNPGAFYSKIGKTPTFEDRLDTYQAYTTKKMAITEAKQRMQTAAKEKSGLMNDSLRVTKIQMGVKAELEGAEEGLRTMQHLNHTHEKIGREIAGLTERKKRLEGEMLKKQEMLQGYDRQEVVVSEAALRKLQESYGERHGRYVKAAEEEGRLEVELYQVMKSIESLEQRRDQKGEVSEVKGREYAQELRGKVEEGRRRKKELDEEVSGVREEMEKVQKKNYDDLDRLTAASQQLEYCLSRLNDLKDIDMTPEQLQAAQASLSLSRDHSRLQPLINPQHQVVCQRLQRYQGKLRQKRGEVREWEEVQREVSRGVDELEVQKHRHLKNVFEEFQKHFKEVFGFVTAGGTTDVRLGHGPEGPSGLTKGHYGLEVRVGWSGEPPKGWSDLSGGQKTLVSLSFLLALQRCCPAPYYVLDEVDAALDPVYLPRIVELIARQSQHAQFFISTFKQSMSAFPEDVANYYLVEGRQRVSGIRRVGKDEVPEIVDKLMSAM